MGSQILNTEKSETLSVISILVRTPLLYQANTYMSYLNSCSHSGKHVLPALKKRKYFSTC